MKVEDHLSDTELREIVSVFQMLAAWRDEEARRGGHFRTHNPSHQTMQDVIKLPDKGEQIEGMEINKQQCNRIREGVQPSTEG